MITIDQQSAAIADQVEPDFRVTGKRSCTSHSAKRWNAAYEAARLALSLSAAPAARYLNRVDGKVYVFVAETDGTVAFTREGRDTPHYLGRSEFDKRFEPIPPAPPHNVAPPDGVSEEQYEYAADRLVWAIEGELDGLMIDMAKARSIVDFVLTETFGRAPAHDVVGWRDIATAPTDERLILIGSYNGRGQWCSEVWSTRYLRDQFAKSADGFFLNAPHLEWLPTHWAELPMPPALSAQEGSNNG